MIAILRKSTGDLRKNGGKRAGIGWGKMRGIGSARRFAAGCLGIAREPLGAGWADGWALGRWGAGALGRWGAGALGRWDAGTLGRLDA
ncbi:hypothetical protein WJ02_02795 [Burkholderia vietnamiensis]|nr:hypothetical protein WJ02_02795 [Burkholderia vietnamiensis]